MLLFFVEKIFLYGETFHLEDYHLHPEVVQPLLRLNFFICCVQGLGLSFLPFH